ncbi:hypothetical protein ABIC10_009571 [Bradyrhizobium sp. S3.2.12]
MLSLRTVNRAPRGFPSSTAIQTATSMSCFPGPIAVTTSKPWPENDAYAGAVPKRHELGWRHPATAPPRWTRSRMPDRTRSERSQIGLRRWQQIHFGRPHSAAAVGLDLVACLAAVAADLRNRDSCRFKQKFGDPAVNANTPAHLRGGNRQMVGVNRDPHHVRLLTLAAGDRGQQAREIIDREGNFHRSLFGSPKITPRSRHLPSRTRQNRRRRSEHITQEAAALFQEGPCHRRST